MRKKGKRPQLPIEEAQDADALKGPKRTTVQAQKPVITSEKSTPQAPPLGQPPPGVLPGSRSNGTSQHGKKPISRFVELSPVPEFVLTSSTGSPQPGLHSLIWDRKSNDEIPKEELQKEDSDESRTTRRALWPIIPVVMWRQDSNSKNKMMHPYRRIKAFLIPPGYRRMKKLDEMVSSTTTAEPQSETTVDSAVIGLVIGISVVVFFIIIVNCFTLRVYLKENKDDRSFHEQEFTYSDHRSFRYGGGRSPQHGVLSDDSIWDADCSTIEFQL